jgi:hypothetical protein
MRSRASIVLAAAVLLSSSTYGGGAQAIPEPGPPCIDDPRDVVPPGPPKPNRILYIHGRDQYSWPARAMLGGGPSNTPNWEHKILGYDGSSRLSESPRNYINDELQLNCNAPNQCVIICFSAGCARLLLSLDDLAGVNKTPNRILWIQAAASAAGGSELAVATTGGGLATFWARISGSSARIDQDLWPSRMRQNLGYIQNRAPVPMYHVAGRKNICKGFLFGTVKVCGNRYFPGEYGDGAVPIHSSCGFSAVGAFADCATGYPKFTNRQTASAPQYNNSHATILGPAIVNATQRLAVTTFVPVPSMADYPQVPTNARDCNNGTPECDQPEWRDLFSCVTRSPRPAGYQIMTGDTWPGGTARTGWTPPAY